jgi:hypothetical protein
MLIKAESSGDIIKVFLRCGGFSLDMIRQSNVAVNRSDKLKIESSEIRLLRSSQAK